MRNQTGVPVPVVQRIIAALILRLAATQARRLIRTDPTPRGPLTAIVLSALLVVTTAALGPSAAAQHWPGAPPFAADLHLGAGLVTALLAIAIVVGTYGLLGCRNALARGWSPNPKRLFAASALVVAALAVLPPIGSADPGSYVAYGRLAATSHDPYVTPPSALVGSYGELAEAPWRETPSVYGPLATGEQRLAASIGGEDPARAVFVLDLVNAFAFVGAGLILFKLAGTLPAQRRIAVMFCANPLVLLTGVAGEHLDVLVAFFAVAAVGLVRSRGAVPAFASGVLAGAAVAIKASAALVALALGWPFQRHTRLSMSRLAGFVVGVVAVLVPAYVWAGHHAFDQLRHASGYISFASPWRLITHPLAWLVGMPAARDLIRIAGWLAFVVFGVLLKRGLPGRRVVGPAGEVRGAPETAARAALVLVFAWLLTAPYALPWYAVVAWALLATVPASGYDRVLAVWTATLALAYLPGRQLPLSPALHDVLTVWKSGVAPVILLAAAAAAATLAVRRRI